MKNIITILALILGLGVSNAQERGPRQQRNPEEMAKMQVERLKSELQLSQAQQDSIHKYILAIAAEQQKIFKDAGDNREAAMKSVQTLREKHTKKIKTFLTEDQIIKYDQLEQQRRQRFEGQGGRGQRPTPNN